MRCNQAVLSAFLVHPRYGPEAADWALTQRLGWDLARFLPVERAREKLAQGREELVARQARSGLWKPRSPGTKEHAPALSFEVLRAVAHAGWLGEIGAPALPLRYDPFPPFAQAEDARGLLVRRWWGRPLPEDERLAASLIADLTARQREDGSWGGTVVGTALAVEQLRDLGAPVPPSAAPWLLSQYRPTFERRRQGLLTAESLFCSDDGGAEFAGAQREIPETIPRHSCYGHLPLIPTGLTLRVLVALGHATDPRVEAAYASLLDLAGPTYAETGWCAHQCVFRLEDRLRAERKAKRG